ncbi:probable glycine betaine transporter [Hydractinia symbiolongicarpus]|uniref:probable glycine betaine transporter n=1 Tax=Hydractinia symbiolongicarpus TaxID=13093 RepID=UPI00254D3DFA|nr:probable glycine betaine transporter [Hydractinia symbiolongicarpus]
MSDRDDCSYLDDNSDDGKARKASLMESQCEKLVIEDSIVNDFTDRCLHVKGNIGPFKYYFNPLTTVASAIIIWAFVVWCIVLPTESYNEIKTWKIWITEKWTWLYIGTQDVWALFIIVLYFSKYSHLKLGGDNEKPEFSDGSYFTMLFAAGIGIGLFFFGVAEPVYHMEPGQYGNRYWGRYSDNQRAQDAMNLTFFHWGLHGWVVYVLIGLLLGFLSYRKGLPMTMRTCFYPLLGEKVFGRIGDMVDTLSIICTMFGVCTSLGLGVIQLNSGLHRVNSNIAETVTVQIIIIWAITAVATVSVISGLKVGIRRLSEVCFGVGCLIMLIVFFADDTWFLLNLFVQSSGYYLQWLVQIGFHTDAFAMKGDAPDGKQNSTWMDAWTIFYWGWWISWSPFVGMFIAKISRGRTIKEFIMYTLTIPIVYTFFWLTVFGGAGISMERKAQNLNITCEMYKPTGIGATAIWDKYNLHKLSCRASTEMWFDVVEQYGDIGSLLSILSLIGLVLYFVTSSDSGSLVIDCLSANGSPDPPLLQRIFWALTEGATATALLKAGGTEALQALQTVAVAAGLPLTIILNFACVALWRAVRVEFGEIKEDDGKWKISLFDSFSSFRRIQKTLFSVIAPWYLVSKSTSTLSKTETKSFVQNSIVLATLFYGWLVLLCLEATVAGISYVGWSLLLAFFACASSIRSAVREKYDLQGNMAEDFFAFCLMYPCATVQLHEEVQGTRPQATQEMTLV